MDDLVKQLRLDAKVEASQHEFIEVKDLVKWKAADEIEELRHVSRMWRDRYTSIYASAAMHTPSIFGKLQRVFDSWYREINESYKADKPLKKN